MSKRIAAIRRRHPGPLEEVPEDAGRGDEKKLLGFALRVGVEFVASVAVGAGIGFTLDHWTGTGPVGLVVGFFLGATAGFLNVYRFAMKEIATPPDPSGTAKHSNDEKNPDEKP